MNGPDELTKNGHCIDDNVCCIGNVVPSDGKVRLLIEGHIMRFTIIESDIMKKFNRRNVLIIDHACTTEKIDFAFFSGEQIAMVVIMTSNLRGTEGGPDLLSQSCTEAIV